MQHNYGMEKLIFIYLISSVYRHYNLQRIERTNLFFIQKMDFACFILIFYVTALKPSEANARVSYKLTGEYQRIIYRSKPPIIRVPAILSSSGFNYSGKGSSQKVWFAKCSLILVKTRRKRTLIFVLRAVLEPSIESHIREMELRFTAIVPGHQRTATNGTLTLPLSALFVLRGFSWSSLYKVREIYQTASLKSLYVAFTCYYYTSQLLRVVGCEGFYSICEVTHVKRKALEYRR